MNIALCVKQVLDATGPLSLVEETESLDNMGLVPVVNPADLAALAMVRQALLPGFAKVTAISIGPKSAEQVLRACVASGSDEAVRVWDKALSANIYEADMIAGVLAAVISRLGFDLIVCGSKGLCGASGYIGPALAELLNLPQICSVSHLEISSQKDVVTVYRRLDRGDREIITCKLPAVITVDEGAAEIPYSSFPDMLASERIEIPVMDFASIGFKYPRAGSRSSGRLLHYVPPRPRTKRTPLPDPSLNPLQIISGGATKKNSNLVEKEPKKAASEIVSFLVSNSILS